MTSCRVKHWDLFHLFAVPKTKVKSTLFDTCSMRKSAARDALLQASWSYFLLSCWPGGGEDELEGRRYHVEVVHEKTLRNHDNGNVVDMSWKWRSMNVSELMHRGREEAPLCDRHLVRVQVIELHRQAVKARFTKPTSLNRCNILGTRTR